MFKTHEEIINLIRSLDKLIVFKEIVVKDETELDELYELYNKNSDKVYFKDFKRRKSGEPFLLLGKKMSCKSSDDYEHMFLREKEKVRMLTDTIVSIGHKYNVPNKLLNEIIRCTHEQS